ncbi:MAG: CoA ester lyase [Sphingomonas fennica]
MIRSALFLPAANARAIEKARTLPADAVILDLEDSVAAEMKAAARAQAVAALTQGGFGGRTLVVRINRLDSEWGAADAAAIAAARPAAIAIPKARSAADLAAHRAAASGLPLWAMVESCGAVLGLAGLAAAPGLQALVLGPNDLLAEMRARPQADRRALWPAMAALVMAARANGLVALDGVCNDFRDLDAFAEEAQAGRDFGFDGKTLIHPAQIAPCNAAFSPSPAELDEARAIVAAFADPANAGKGAIRLGTRMIEGMHLAAAERLLAAGVRGGDE